MSFWKSTTNMRDALAQLDAINRSQAIIEFNTDGTIITANKNFLDTMGYRLDEIQGKHHSMFVFPEARNGQEYRTFWDDLKLGKYRTGAYKRCGKGGRLVWIRASYNPVLDRNGKPTKIVKFASDITEQKIGSMEDAGKINAINRSQAVIEFNTDGKIITANKNFLDAMGYSLAEIQGKHHQMFVAPGERDSAAYREFWA